MLLATTGATWVHTTQQQQTAMANPTHKPVHTNIQCMRIQSRVKMYSLHAQEKKSNTRNVHKNINA